MAHAPTCTTWQSPSHPSPTPAAPPSAPRARSRAPTPRSRTPRWRRSRPRSTSRIDGDPRRQRARHRGRRARAGLSATRCSTACAGRGARRARSRAGVRQIAALPDPVGEVIDGHRLPNGLDVRKVRVPLGVVAVVYEARPNVTIDAAALCLKSGNAIVLRGSSSADALQRRARRRSPPTRPSQRGCRTAAEPRRRRRARGARRARHPDGRRRPDHPARRRGPQGRRCRRVATVPVIYAASGNCHVYVDASADLEQAQAIVLNAKMQRPGVCNAAETLLVHERVAADFLPRVLRALRRRRRRAARRRTRPRARSPSTARSPI